MPPVPQIASFETLPAPSKGLDAITNLMAMDPMSAIYMLNMIPTTGGPTVRPGWQEWCTNLAGSGGVRTIISSRGAGTGGQDFLFAATLDGIYDISASSTAPTLVLAWPNQTGNAGYVEWDHSTNLLGNVVLIVCDQQNGYFTYDTATSTWTHVTQGFTGQGSTAGTTLTISLATSGTIVVGGEVYTASGGVYTDTGFHVVSGSGPYTLSGSPALAAGTNIVIVNNTNQIVGVNPAVLSFPRVFNNRVWFIQEATGMSWYLNVGGVYGFATSFSWGNKFPHGGNLSSLQIFTYGSYYGTFIYLVGVGFSGDILAYSGTDPSQAATWTLSGQWYVGDLPAGKRSVTNFGGDLLVLCAQGILPVSSLFFQKDIDDPSLYLSQKIAPAITSDMQQYSTFQGWSFISWPGLGCLVITEPILPGVTPKQFVYNFQTKSWTIFNGLNWQHGAFWHNSMFVGTSDGRVLLMAGNVDGALLDGTPGVAITWGCLGSFQQGKNPGVTKFVDLIRAYLTASIPPVYQIFAQWDFDLTQLTLGSVPYTTAPAVGSAWDSGVWDLAMWSAGSQAMQSIGIQGAEGSGEFVAIGIIGASEGSCTLVGYGVSARITKGFL